MKKMSIVLAAFLALPVFAGSGHRTGLRHAPPPPRPAFHARREYRVPPPPPCRRYAPPVDPVTAGILGVGTLLLTPRYRYVPGHWETVTTVLPDGRTATSTTWAPGQYVRIR